MDIYIDEHSSSILIRMKWKYIWVQGEHAPWTYMEKKSFHHKSDSIIWQKLGEVLSVQARGTSDFAKRHKNTIWKINFDIQWVLNDEHWTVIVKKIPKGTFATSKTSWKNRKLYLDSNDFEFSCKKTVGNKKYNQRGVLHEFGHAMGNTIAIKGMHGDEYKQSSSYFNDYNSLMHSAEEIRIRHIDYIISVLNSWIPDTIFEASSQK